MIPVARENYDSVTYGNVVESESMSKRIEDRVEMKRVLDIKWMEYSLRLCRLRTVPLLALLIED